MSTRLCGFAVLWLLCVSSTASACDWGRAHGDLRWCMDKNNGARGRGEICLNLARGSSQFMGGVENGFRDCQRDGGSRANFKNCKDENQDRLYNDGRSMLDLCN
jgi:hypothetical protein